MPIGCSRVTSPGDVTGPEQDRGYGAVLVANDPKIQYGEYIFPFLEKVTNGR